MVARIDGMVPAVLGAARAAIGFLGRWKAIVVNLEKLWVCLPILSSHLGQLESYDNALCRETLQMTSVEAKEISESYQKLSKKNTLRPNLGPGGYQAKLSSHGSVADTNKYPVNDITENTPCSLHMTLSKRGNTLVKVADGIVIPGRTFHNVTIPHECARVQIVKVDENYLSCDLDYPDEDEGIETLEDVVNHFILWPRREIVIHTIPSP
ncbi:hypothetical protein PR202_ga22497 [Eleusine coracana subsp. coracana]|uniref:DUF8039 domain-containing protein n=1 Tax=Eleusine coracana subsp. coracana TaxID=191504 RepID=A0AAV5D488_ELECO|nr:hypothetical protein PR202_ga22497 [Eleusine coracana subsp. coracana]